MKYDDGSDDIQVKRLDIEFNAEYTKDWWMPIHLGHKRFLVDPARRYDKLVVGIGSCHDLRRKGR